MKEETFYLIHSDFRCDRSILSGQKVLEVFDSGERCENSFRGFSISMKPMATYRAIPSLLIVDSTLDGETLCALTLMGLETITNNEFSLQVDVAINEIREIRSK